MDQSRIVRGVLSNASDDAVVGIEVSPNACTAALIAPDVILTALHCVSEFNTLLPFTCQSDGSLSADSAGGMLGPLVDPAKISIGAGVMPSRTGVHGKVIYGTNSPVICRDDIAVVVLDGDVPVDVPPVSLRFTRLTKEGESVRAVGYGQTDNTTDMGRFERDDLSILGVGSPDTVMSGDRGVAPRTVMIGEGPCHGDNGGPLLSADTGAAIGVYSIITTNTCEGPDVRNVYTQIAPYEELIRTALASVGEEPLVEVTAETGDGGATGEAGAGGSAGAADSAGAAGEAGARVEPATGGAGGHLGVGGNGGTQGGRSGAAGGSMVPGTSGNDAMGGAGASTGGADGRTTDVSRTEAGCTCRSASSRRATAWPLLGLSFVALSFGRRRRRR